MEDTWVGRDLPVLESIVRLTDQSGHEVWHGEIEDDTSFSPEDVQRAIKALNSDGSYIRVSAPAGNGRIDCVYSATGKARQAVGAWPTAESLTDCLLSRLQQIADDEAAEPEVRDRARQGLKAFLGAGRDILVGAAGSALSAGLIG